MKKSAQREGAKRRDKAADYDWDHLIDGHFS